MQTDGEKIKLLRKSMGLSQKDFGDKFDYSGQQISNFENNLTPATRLITILKAKYGENFSQLPVEYAFNEQGRQPGDQGPSAPVTTEEMALIRSIRQLEPGDKKSVYISVIGLLNNLEKEKETRKDKQKKQALADCIRDLSRAVARVE